MKTFHTFVGIDISKLTLDVSVTQSDKPNKVTHYKVNNNIKGVIGLITQLKNKAVCLEDTLFVCENTGIYPPPL